MPVPTLITELSQTPGSNSPSGSESPITTDNYFRTYAAFIAQLQAEKAPLASPTFTGVVSSDLGAVALPSYTFTGDANTGMWSPGADMLAWSTGGSERVRVDSSGNVGIGITSPGKRLDVRAIGANAAIRLQETATYGVLWDIDVGSANAMTFTNNGGSPLNYVFNNGHLGIGVTPTARNNTRLQILDGIGFPATQVASSDPNTLDDYEEGVWTPSVTSSSGTITTLGTVAGTYTKVGRWVKCFYSVAITTNGTAAGILNISGLPFARGTSCAICGSGREDIVTGSALAVAESGTASVTVQKYDNTWPGGDGTLCRGFFEYFV